MKKRPTTGYQWARARMTAALKAEIASDHKAEEQIHLAIVELLEAAAAPSVRFWHTPNGGKRSKAEAARFKRMGVKAGVPDLIVSIPGAVAFLEIKAAHGRLSEAQENFLAAMAANGHQTAVVRSLDEAARVLTSWGAIVRVRVAA